MQYDVRTPLWNRYYLLIETHVPNAFRVENPCGVATILGWGLGGAREQRVASFSRLSSVDLLWMFVFSCVYYNVSVSASFFCVVCDAVFIWVKSFCSPKRENYCTEIAPALSWRVLLMMRHCRLGKVRSVLELVFNTILRFVCIFRFK